MLPVPCGASVTKCVRLEDLMGWPSFDCIALYGKGDFADVIEVSHHLPLSSSRGRLFYVGLASSGEPLNNRKQSQTLWCWP